MITKLTFDLSPPQIKSLALDSTTKLKAQLAAIGALKSTSSAVDLDLALAEFSNSLGVAIFLKYVSPDPLVRQAADEVEMEVQKLLVDIFTRADLFEAVRNSEAFLSQKDPIEAELIKDYLFNFRKNGLDLSAPEREAFINKKKRLVELEAEFSKNLMEENTRLAFLKEDLKGLPDSFIQSLPVVDYEKVEISLSYPHVTPFMENVWNKEARKKVSFFFNNRGGEKNKNLMEEALRIRHELAQMLGYKNHAELVLSKRMAASPDKALLFLQDLKNKFSVFGEKERKALSNLKQTLLKDSSPLQIYEWRFLHNQMLKANYDFDPLKVQEYFPLETVLSGMFEIYQTLLGVQFRKDASASVWHSTVQKFEVWNQGHLISHFYMDLFPREGKYNHAAAFTLISAFQMKDSKYQIPFSSIVANFSPPTNERPSLLLHTEVETLFHEFGHIMHQILTQAKYPSFSGT